MPTRLPLLRIPSQILRTVERHAITLQDAVIALFDLFAIQNDHLTIGTLEADELVLRLLDNPNQILEVSNIAPLNPVDHQHFNIVVTLVRAIGQYLLQHYDL